MQDINGLKILHVEDSDVDYEILARVFTGNTVHRAKNQSEAIAYARTNTYDIIFLDINLGTDDGFHICSEIRRIAQNQETPIMMVTGKNSTADKVLALGLGADDYVSKPFDVMELKARTQALSRRKKSISKMNVGPFTLDLAKYNLNIQTSEGDRVLSLTALELKILSYLMAHPDQVVSRSQILDAVWGDGIHVNDRTVDSRVSNLRKKLNPFEDAIRSVYGVGYQFSVSFLSQKQEAA